VQRKLRHKQAELVLGSQHEQGVAVEADLLTVLAPDEYGLVDDFEDVEMLLAGLGNGRLWARLS